jgi:hypothetical protein
MRFAANNLRDKALLALEEASQQCRYGQVPRTFAIRFALAYLWSLAPTSREPFDEFWRSLPRDDMWRFGAASSALTGIYRHLGIEQNDELTMAMWKRCKAAQEATKG